MSSSGPSEVTRTGHGAAPAGSPPPRGSGAATERGPAGPVPEDNQPAHHPEPDQDKPTGPPPRPRPEAVGRPEPEPEQPEPASEPQPEHQVEAASTPVVRRRFAFRFAPRMLPWSLAVGVSPLTSGVEVGDGELRVRFGLWSLETPLTNVAGAEVPGPYTWWKVAGPAHLSFADAGVTFATATGRGVCVRFRRPVGALVPFGLVRHPAATLTVADPEGLVAALEP